MFKVNNKDIRTTPMAFFWCFCCNFRNSTPFSSVSIVNFEQLNAGWVLPLLFIWGFPFLMFSLTHFSPMFCFYTPEDIGKPLVFYRLQGYRHETLSWNEWSNSVAIIIYIKCIESSYESSIHTDLDGYYCGKFLISMWLQFVFTNK